MKDAVKDEDEDTIKKNIVPNIILCFWYIALAGLIFQSMKGNEEIYKHFGFMKGKLSKALFLLFVASLTFPIAG